MSIFQLSVQKCSSYQSDAIAAAVSKLLAPLGGIESFVKPGFRVLIKPNMLTCKDPEKAATTHPAVIEEIARLCVNAGAKVIIGDSPPAVFGRTEEFWKKTGFFAAATRSGADLFSFETDSKSPLKFFTNGREVTTHVIKTLFRVDAVINIAKMKTHNLTRITGAVKNLFGLIPGFSKAQWHKVFPRAEEFSDFIADFAHQIPVTLNIMDGIESMDGQGPAGGRVVKSNLLFASTSPVAIDMGFCQVVGLEPSEVPTLRRCKQLNWGPKTFAELQFVGYTPDEAKISGFNVPRTPPISMIPDIIIRLARRLVWAGPVLLPDTCIKCGRCRQICPADAIKITAGGAEFERNLCISCFCCMEVCPVEAIEMKSSPLLALGLRLRGLKRHLRQNKK
ncbi:MAG: DUF362 domain-containing protein [Candidatus Riflebacteria bacterium]|jgi:uncharacterized protein (DUF362 family)/Pyruvate/2-oxoacid:ferredoxin oxidoreductase delta subunit|nr:DUF362 domain-containing protein [Candidatus Riflebacteria bacterium]